MAEITIPTFCESSASFGLLRADNVLELMTGKEVFTDFAKAVWTYSFSLPVQTEDHGRVWAAALSQLSRISNYFKATPPGYKGAAYNATTLQVNGANQVGMVLNLKGAQNNTLILKVGEYFEVNGELKIVTSNVTSNGSGLAVVNFEPPLRNAPPDSSNLNLQTPKAKFRLANPQASWAVGPKMFHSISLDCVEVI